MKITLFFYRFLASLLAIISYLRGESQKIASYENQNRNRIRFNLNSPRQFITYDWENIEKGVYKDSLVIYAATIGELRSAMPFIDTYILRAPNKKIVIFSGQLQYLESIHMLYPHAALGVLPPCAPWLYDKLFNLLRPCAVVLSEGPSLYLHFPLAFDLALPAACLRHSIPALVVNATVYPFNTYSIISKIENLFFRKIFTQAIRHWYTPNNISKNWLINAGAPPSKITTTGDLRFNAKSTGSISKELREILTHIRQKNDPVIVVGSVNFLDEEAPTIEGWLEVRKKHKHARLIMAPRHVNNSENMTKLYEYLNTKGVQYAKRSEGVQKVKDVDLLVVDVFGELSHYYSIASVAYIGRNHTLFEPLHFEVPTVVAPRTEWNANYVTYPAYMQMVEAEGVIEVQDKKYLGEVFTKIIDNTDYGRGFVLRALQLSKTEQGAADKIFENLKAHHILQ